MAERQRVRADLPLRRAPDVRVGLALPVPLSMRVDVIAAKLTDAGFRVSRRDLFAVAVLSLPDDSEVLVELLERYRTATVGDALPANGHTTVTLQRSGPGPRPARQGSAGPSRSMRPA